MFEAVESESCPDIAIGPHCDDPYGCEMKDKCFAFLPEHNPLTLNHMGKKAYGWIRAGVTDIRNFDSDVKLSKSQLVQIESVRTRTPHVDRDAVREFLARLVYPVYYLDFETVGPAIPLYEGTRPFEQVPFQFSLHVQASPGSEPVHTGYLAEGRDDPRPEWLRLLKQHLGDHGSIVCYHESFEKTVLRRACEAYPEYRVWNMEILNRMIDLIEPFRGFDYYHYDQLGSASLKSVFPVLTGKSYDDMAIGDGMTASREFLRVTFGEADDDERRLVRKNLIEYCCLDTMAMVEIVGALRLRSG